MRHEFFFASLVMLVCFGRLNTPCHAGAVGMMHSRPVKAGVNPSPSIHTIVAGGNVPDVGRDIQAWHDEQHPECKFVKVVAAELLAQEERSITEKWTIEACDAREFAYEVFLMPDAEVLVDGVMNLDAHL